MRKYPFRFWPLLAVLFCAPTIAETMASKHTPVGCDGFSRDLSRELALLAQQPAAIDAGRRGEDGSARIEPSMSYAAKLAPQAEVALAVEPRKTWPDAGHFSGMLTFQVPASGRYRVSVSTRLWIEVVDGGAAVPTLDFEGGHSCPLLRKTVEFDLVAGRDLLLQLSGSAQEHVRVLITEVTSADS